jgi:hypothetical protein
MISAILQSVSLPSTTTASMVAQPSCFAAARRVAPQEYSPEILIPFSASGRRGVLSSLLASGHQGDGAEAEGARSPGGVGAQLNRVSTGFNWVSTGLNFGFQPGFNHGFNQSQPFSIVGKYPA